MPVVDDARGAYVRGLLSEMTGDGDAARTAIRALCRNTARQHPYYWSPFLLISR
jgi:CHAT domain-containing protein